ncbi:GDSL esterase/lipase plant-like protein, putative [Medicago truncatula]|uniref:GDSL esterase/lipase plant-like protein, putative n=1 Tax=Medicago truncatula TaxID=3880 RepID=G7LF73_MEDTR|nr:GDSL esterase/lipase plant-like protein, putative [Medicago truncatula]
MLVEEDDDFNIIFCLVIHQPYIFTLTVISLINRTLEYGEKSSEEQVRRSIPDILSQFSQAVQIHNERARVFSIHNTGPIGCLPYDNIYYPHKKGNLDANGCFKPHNELAQE